MHIHEPPRGRPTAAALATAFLAALCTLTFGCSRGLDFDVQLQIVDESGATVAGATVIVGGQEYQADSRGRIGFGKLMGATLAVVRADGYLPEPVTVGRDADDEIIQVRLISTMGGRRWAMHSSGDVMFGRRYNAPPEGDPLIPADNAREATRAVVAYVAPAFGAADLRTVNLETVVSDMPPEAAYPGKRFILNSWPETMDGIFELGVDAVDLANNHARDYMDVGVAATITSLTTAGIPYFGASSGPEPADDPYITTLSGGVTVGVFGWTTVDGTFVNDNYPDENEPVPPDLQPTELWQYVTRPWGYTGAEWDVPVADRRIGEVWRLFKAKEDSLSDAAVAEVWASMAHVYPELQDWVARRGHGGAAFWDTARSTARIAEIAPLVDVLVVQLHSGFQFQVASSTGTRLAARRAIDAGADVVICHHPHVLQGAEWYKGKLIVYSLGNFVFDQDFLATFPSAFLRTVWDGDQLLEARFVPVELIDYKTRPVADRTATRTLLRLWEMSIMRAEAARDPQDDVYVYELEPDADTVPANMRIERNTARIVAQEVPEEVHRIALEAGRVEPIAYDGLIDPRMGLDAPNSDIFVGRDLLGWGRFEDEVADGEDSYNAHWAFDDGTSKMVMTDGDTPDGVAYLRLSRYYTNSSSVVVRPVARIPMWRHRMYRDLGGRVAEPVDSDASYSLYFRARRKGQGVASVRLDLYHFDDTDPTEDPDSVLLGQHIEDIDITNDDQWHTVHMDIPASAFENGEFSANMVLLYVRLAPPYKSKTTFDIDELGFIEWRNAAQMPDRKGLYDFVRNRGNRPVTLSIPALPASDTQGN